MKCSNHSEKDFSGICIGCGKPMCNECLVEVGKKNYCKDCLDDKVKKSDNPQNIIIKNNNSSSSSSSASASASASASSGGGDTLTTLGGCCCCIIIIASAMGW